MKLYETSYQCASCTRDYLYPGYGRQPRPDRNTPARCHDCIMSEEEEE